MPNGESNHPQAQRLGYVLKVAQHSLRGWMDEQLDSLGITTPQYNVLSAVESHPGISNAALAREAFVTAQSMLGIVANLERAGYIRRTAHPTHGRIRSSELTPAGLKVLKKAHERLARVDETMTASLSNGEVETLRSLLQRCIGNLRRE